MSMHPAPTILVVDDNPDNAAVVSTFLEARGYAVVVAHNGDEALLAFERLRPALVLLDVNLPDIDGFAVAARLTADDGAPDVVLVSSRDARDFGPMVGRSGARGFLSKADLSGDALRELVA